jgi:hypothetical protein
MPALPVGYGHGYGGYGGGYGHGCWPRLLLTNSREARAD